MRERMPLQLGDLFWLALALGAGLALFDAYAAHANMANPIPVTRTLYVPPYACGFWGDPVKLTVGSQVFHGVLPGECRRVRDFYWNLTRARLICPDGRVSGETELLGKDDPRPTCGNGTP